ncbi:MAG: hypothetical protein Q9182_002065 [Xanthomendoza sp. 2 TL-2023]
MTALVTRDPGEHHSQRCARRTTVNRSLNPKQAQDANNQGSNSEEEVSDLNMEELSNVDIEGSNRPGSLRHSSTLTVITESPPASPAWPTIGDVHRALRPLQAEADRVGKQVEEFAETLDRLSNDNREIPRSDCSHALRLVDGYRQIAKSTVAHLENIHAPERQKRTGVRPENTSRSSLKSSTHSTTTDDLEKWQQEEQTWHLLALMLQVQYPSSGAQAASSGERLVRPSKEIEIDQYSSESAVWSHFLAHDDQAWERHTVVDWLKTCAKESGQPIESVIQDLEINADRGSGLWAHSWLYTKEAIKGQKRLRSWPQTLAPDSPGIDKSLRNSNQNQSLITQLDPDAVSRQGRSLELQDENFEKATWLACWEMVRRGEDWNFIRDWCQERVENWRAITVRGDPRHQTLKPGKAPRDPGVAAGWQSRALWRRVCAVAAQTDGMDDYEAAVYGLVSGYLPSVKKVCGSWNDYLFAHYNCYLLRSFDDYIARNFSGRCPRPLQDKSGPFNVNLTGGSRVKSGNHLVILMRILKSVGEEAQGSFKLLQGSLIGKTFDEFVKRNGGVVSHALRSLSQNRKPSKFLRYLEKAKAEGKIPALIKPDDYHVIRIVTHIALIYRELGPPASKNGNDSGVEDFIDAYINFLSMAGKQQLLPLYASCLSPERAISCMAREIRLILEHGERRTMMRLMKEYGIDLPRVLNMQLQMTMKNSEDNEEKDPGYPTLSILESKKQGEMRTIRGGFMGAAITNDQHDLINGFEWYLLLDGHWEQTLAIGAVLYTYFLRLAGSKGLAAAKEMSKRVSFSSLSLGKTKAILGQEIDISGIYDEDEDGMQGRRSSNTYAHHPIRHGRSGSRSMRYSQTEREQYLFKQSNTFLNLEQLIHVLTALEGWQVEVDRKPSNIDLGGPVGKKWRDSLRRACERVEANTQPLLHGWLLYSHDDNEARDLEQIRAACLPEVLLAYTAVLNYSAQYLSRSYLLQSLELGALVAAPDSDLAGCFVSTKRMPELVDALAVTSMNMVLAEEYGIGSKKMSPKMGLWSGKGAPSTER